MGMGFAPTWLR